MSNEVMSRRDVFATLDPSSGSTAMNNAFHVESRKINVPLNSEEAPTRLKSGKFAIVALEKTRIRDDVGVTACGQITLGTLGVDSTGCGIVYNRNWAQYACPVKPNFFLAEGYITHAAYVWNSDSLIADCTPQPEYVWLGSDREHNALTSPQAVSTLENDVKVAATLPADWPGSAIDEKSLQTALKVASTIEWFLRKYHPKMPQPYVSPTMLGGIVFEWFGKTTAGRQLILTVEPDGIMVFMTDGRGHERESELLELFHLNQHLRWLATGTYES